MRRIFVVNVATSYTIPPSKVRVGAKQRVHWFLGGMVAFTQQGTIVWVGSPFPPSEACGHSVSVSHLYPVTNGKAYSSNWTPQGHQRSHAHITLLQVDKYNLNTILNQTPSLGETWLNIL